jgi:hypothetical protein
MTRPALGSLITAVALTSGFGASLSSAQELGAPETYGAGLSVHTIPAVGFRLSSGPFAWSQNPDRYVYGTTTNWVAPLMLPSGAFIDHIEFEVCDDDTLGTLEFAAARIIRCPRTGSCILTASADTISVPPGCGHVSSPLLNLFVDNLSYSYQVDVDLGFSGGEEIRFRAVRVFYRLLVSAPPTTATFTDVPVGHQFHRFVEALSAAGITAGCAPTLYCPDAPLTRGQMAVFLSVALGLHFP